MSALHFIARISKLFIRNKGLYIMENKVACYQDEDFRTRFRPTTISGRSISTEIESDRGRIVFSPAFRRLQQKTQVFPLEANSAVRSRLTHSLEVAQIGRWLAKEAYKEIGTDELSQEVISVIPNVVENACLIHDIGNPPFGHSGESSIKSWFDKNKDVLINNIEDNIEDNIEERKNWLGDFVNFDGNPQGFRVVSRLQGNGDNYGLNLTYATLSTYFKYVTSPETLPQGANDTRDGKSKIGFFLTEVDIVKKLSLYDGDKFKRYPLSFLLEAADDIAYCISDIQDAIEKDIVTESFVLQEMLPIAKNAMGKENDLKYRKILEGNNVSFLEFKTTVTRFLVDRAAKKYGNEYKNIISGAFNGSLIDKNSCEYEILASLKGFSRNFVYNNRQVIMLELAGHNIIGGLLDFFKPLMVCSEDKFTKWLKYEASNDGQNHKILHLFPKQYKEIYRKCLEENNSMEWLYRLHLIVDFVSGMTDDFARDFYQTMASISI